MYKLSTSVRNLNSFYSIQKLPRTFSNRRFPYSPYNLGYSVFRDKSLVFNELWKMGFDYKSLSRFWQKDLRTFKRISAFLCISVLTYYYMKDYYKQSIPLLKLDDNEENVNITKL